MAVLEVYDNTFSDDYVSRFLEYNSSPMWELRNDNFYNDLNEVDFFSKSCVEWINQLTKTEHTLYRCYRYASHSSNPGSPHYDENSDRSFLVWMHPYWDILWGGQLRVGENLETHIDCLPNRSVYLSTKEHQHFVAPHNSNTFRITYVWKLQTV